MNDESKEEWYISREREGWFLSTYKKKEIKKL